MKFFSKKNAVGMPETMPDLPKDATTAAQPADFTPLKKTKHGFNKKSVILLGVVLSLMLVGVTTFIALRSQPQSIKSKAAALASGCVEKVISGSTIRLCPGPDASINGTEATGHFTVEKTSNDTNPVTFTIRESSFWCPTDNGSSCGLNPASADESFTITDPNVPEPFTIVRASDNGEPCGSFQFDNDLQGEGPVWQFLGTGVNCVPGSTGSPVPPTNTPTPTTPAITTPTPSPTVAPNTYRITGRVYSSCTPSVPPVANACTPSGNGQNGITVKLQDGSTVVQTEITHDYPDVNPSPGAFVFNNVPAGTYSVCVTVPSGSKMSCPAVTDTVNCFTKTVPPTDLYNVVNLLDTTCSPLPTNSPTPKLTGAVDNTPTPPTPSVTPKASNTPSPTPTDRVVVITATPTPTTIVVIASTNTPTPTTMRQTSVTSAPTIPSAGSPLPYIAVGIPFILILLAFVL